MKIDFSSGLDESILSRIRRHSEGIENQGTRTLRCHYCGHKAIVVFEDARGHVETKCKKCGQVGIYNVVMLRTVKVMFRFIK